MLRKKFQLRKAKIEKNIDIMLEQLQRLLHISNEAIQSVSPEHLSELLTQVKEIEHSINDSEEIIFNYCMQVISLEQPLASDLRFIIGVLKYISDLERMGDHCVHIVETMCHKKSMIQVPKRLFDMMEKMCLMFQHCIQAIKDLDEEQASQIIAEDSRLDESHKEFIKENACMIHSEPENSETYVCFMFLSRFMERIGDHMVNICEWLLFMIHGTRPS